MTGEAVVLDLRPAAFGSRALSVLIDVAAQVIVVIAAALVLGGTLSGTTLDSSLLSVLLIALLVVVFVAWPVAVETLSRGRSLGRLVMGLRIVRDDGGAIRFRHAFIRGMVAVLEIYFLVGSLAFIVAVFNEKSKRLGDILAGTYAMRERVRARPEPLAVMPEALKSWATLADLGRLPDPLSRRLAQFLAQAPLMTPDSRWRLAADLALETLGFVAPRPPQGTAPEDFLAAVVVERRDRDVRTLGRARERAHRTGERLHRLPYTS